MMGAPLDEKGHSPELVAALRLLKKRLEATPEELRGPFLVKGLKPYLAVSQPIGDGLEVVAWQSRIKPGGNWVFDQMGFDLDFQSKSEAAGYEWRPLVRLSDAQALIAAKDARIDELTRERDVARLHQREVAAGSDRSAIVARIIIAKNEAENRAEVAEYKLVQQVNEIQPMIISRAETAEAQVAALRAALESAKHFVNAHYSPAIDSEYGLMLQIVTALKPSENADGQ